MCVPAWVMVAQVAIYAEGLCGNRQLQVLVQAKLPCVGLGSCARTLTLLASSAGTPIPCLACAGGLGLQRNDFSCQFLEPFLRQALRGRDSFLTALPATPAHRQGAGMDD